MDGFMIVGVTGGTGFIGEKLVERHLQQGDSVRVLSRKPLRARVVGGGGELQGCLGDLTDEACDLSKFVSGLDLLYHCAGELIQPSRMHALHVEGTSRLVSAATGKVGNWVQLSSVGAYGPVASGVVTEESLAAPVGPYEITKTISDEIVTKGAEVGGFNCTILRPSNVYGPSMGNRSLFQMISMLDRGLFFFIGPPGALTNYIHVDNVVDALLLCGKSTGKGVRVYNLSDCCTLEYLIGCLSSSLERPAPRLRVPLQLARMMARALSKISWFPLTESRVSALTLRSKYSTERIEHELGYRHRVSIEDGMSELVGQWRENGRSN
jgi:nucleoside-diphosphate-sugar epimerase